MTAPNSRLYDHTEYKLHLLLYDLSLATDRFLSIANDLDPEVLASVIRLSSEALGFHQEAQNAMAKGELAYALSLVELAQARVDLLASLPT
jgi:hypothetical protein